MNCFFTGLIAFGLSISAYAEVANYTVQLNRLKRVLVGTSLSAHEATQLNDLRTPQQKEDYFNSKRDDYIASKEFSVKLAKVLAEHFYPRSEFEYQDAFTELDPVTINLFKSMVVDDRPWSELVTSKKFILGFKEVRYPFDTKPGDFYASFNSPSRRGFIPVLSEEKNSRGNITRTTLEFREDDFTVSGILTTRDFLSRYASMLRKPESATPGLTTRDFPNNWLRVRKSYELLLCRTPIALSATVAEMRETLNPLGQAFGTGSAMIPINAQWPQRTKWRTKSGGIIDIRGIAQVGEQIASDSDFAACQMQILWKAFSRSYREMNSSELSQAVAHYNSVGGRTSELIKWVVSQKPFTQLSGRPDIFQQQVDLGLANGRLGPHCYSPKEALLAASKALDVPFYEEGPRSCNPDFVELGDSQTFTFGFAVEEYQACFNELAKNYVETQSARGLVRVAIRNVNQMRSTRGVSTLQSKRLSIASPISDLTDNDLYEVTRLLGQEVFEANRMIDFDQPNYLGRRYRVELPLIEGYWDWTLPIGARPEEQATSEEVLLLAVERGKKLKGISIERTLSKFMQKVLKIMLLREEYLCH